MSIEAYPLCWPVGRPRERFPTHSRFRIDSRSAALMELRHEISLMGGDDLIVSSNLPLRKDGQPYASARAPDDQGVAVYFTRNGKQVCFACDSWRTIAENILAIARTIGALRGIERWGSGDMLERAFTGFEALPSPEVWWQVLGLDGPDASREAIESAHRKLIMTHHPDRGGDSETAARINRARDMGISQL